MKLSSPTTTELDDEGCELLPLVTPGQVLLEEFLKPLAMSQYRLARSIGVPPRRINEIVHGTRSVTAGTALRLGRFFGTTALFWMNLQAEHDLRLAERRCGRLIVDQVEPLARKG